MTTRTYLLFIILACAGCSSASESITLATTTSTQDSGLLDVLVPMFEAQTGIDVKVVAVGTGQALELGRRGDADVLLVQDPESERAFVNEGHGQSRQHVMHNDFVVVGPANDPAMVRGLKSAERALERIALKKARFVSRGDESGTHRKEQRIWHGISWEPEGDWYVEAGAGMGAVLRMTGEKQAYTLTDRATYLAQGQDLGLAIMVEGDPALINPYSVILVSAETHPQVHEQAAKRFARFLLSPVAQQAIAEFGVDQFRQPLFFDKNQLSP